MKKKIMSRMLFAALVLGTVGIVSSCKDYDDDISNLQKQIDVNSEAIAANSKAIDQINSLITDGSFIQSVVKNGSGVIITLSNGKSYEITNGENGKDAVVWTIGEDGYWYQDGSKTGYYALGKDGANGKDGTNGTNGKDGANGKDGENGKDGADGIYYYPNPDTGNFDIYNGDGTFKESTTISWRASGSNVITAVMDKNDLKLYGVQTEDGVKTFTIALSNNLRGFVFEPIDGYVDGIPAIRVTSFSYNALSLRNKDSQNETTAAAGKATVVNPTTYAYYHVNPANANVEDLKKLFFVVKSDVDYTTTRARLTGASSDFGVTPEFVSFENGILKVKVDVTGTPATNEKISVVALQTQKSNGEDVTSDYATVFKKDMADLRLADKKKFAASPSVDYHFRRFVNTTDAEAGISSNTIWQLDEDMETIDLTMPYNEKLDLTEYVEAHELSTPNHSIADLERLGMTINYELMKGYKIGSNNTDQAEYVTLSEGVLAVKSEYGTSAIDRTPIVRVTLNHGSEIVKVAYVKVRIVRKGIAPVAKQYELQANPFNFNCGSEGKNTTTYQQMSKYIYASLNMSKTEFHSYYTYFEDRAESEDVGTVQEINTGDNSSQEGTHVLEWTISEQELWEHAGETVTNVVRYYTSQGSQTYVEIKLTSTIASLKKHYNVESSQFITNYWNESLTEAKFNVRVPQTTSDRNSSNCVFVNDLNSPFITNDLGVLKLDNAITKFVYKFCPDMAGSKNIGGKTYNFVVSADGFKLLVGGETIAEIKNDNTSGPANTIEYNKNSAIAKTLLNTGQMYVLIKATGYACEDVNKPISITFNGLDHFRANYIRPVDITKLAADNFIDGVDVGEKGSFIKLEDLISPSDWRGRAFSSYANYWDFYGPFSVTFDRNDAECDLNGVRGKVPAQMELNLVGAGTMGTGGNTKTSAYGFITYKNNGTTVNSPFNIFVKVTVSYGWGDLKTDWITVPVNTTIGQ